MSLELPWAMGSAGSVAGHMLGCWREGRGLWKGEKGGGAHRWQMEVESGRSPVHCSHASVLMPGGHRG